MKGNGHFISKDAGVQADALFDGFGRKINYLRISLTDRCNLRCVYCMPLQGAAFLPRPELLTPAEIERVAQAAVGVGFHKFRLTGGEPTLRPDLVEIVERLAAIPGVEQVTMTTNGLRLPEVASELARAGLQRVNVHVDTLNPDRLPQLMRWGSVDRIWAGILAAEAAGLVPIKINAVVTRGYNEADVVDLARLTVERDWAVRFIELMPLGADEPSRVALDQYVSNAETRAKIETMLGPLEPAPSANPHDESRNFRLPGARGIVGFISPVSEPYCTTCSRMRLTADGKFHLCLLHDDEIDVRSLLRNGASIEEIQQVLARAVALKPTGHALSKGVHTENRRMSQIGG
jgi:GTP 3',8-cyclase